MNQSDTAGVKIPELDLELAGGTLGGIVTTVEGLITKISESEYDFFAFFIFLHFSSADIKHQFIFAGLERVHGFSFGDSLDENKRTKWQDFKAKLNKVSLLIMTS